MACLGITGAMRTAPTGVMEVLLGLPPLQLQVEAEAKVGFYRLHCNKQWNPKSEGFGHTYITQDMEKEHILQIGSDKMIPRHVYDKPFMIRLPDRSEWKKGCQPDRKGRRAYLVYRWFQDNKKALEVGCLAMEQGGNLVLDLCNMQKYSR
jgi:hypothetical protein